MTASMTTIRRACVALALAALLVPLAGCGGGGDDGHLPPPTVDCHARPELCR